MKTIGLIGGTGWISTVEYYRSINQEVNRRLGGLQFARCILYSINYGEMDEANRTNDKPAIYALIRNATESVQRAGADCILLCANTSHQFADELERFISVPLIHIARATAKEILARGYSTVGLLGTKQTMEMDFYRKLLENQNIQVLIPGKEDREFIEYTIKHELLKEIIQESSRFRFLSIIDTLRRSGAGAIVLGCTEIPLLICQENTSVPLLNTLEIHAKAAVDFALAGCQNN